MQMAQIVGGYSLGAADLLRRAMGKKKPEEMAQQRAVFRDGAAKNGLKQAKADELFDLMEKFAGYGFNKSHAAAYALVAYQTAYFKTHHPAAFMAANLSAVMNDTDKVKQFYEDTRINGLKILPPDVNCGEYRFVPVDTGTLSYGLGAIKGTGEAAIAAIVAARNAGGPFRDLFDFCERVDKRLINRRVVEALVRAGAFDAVEPRRANLLASVGIALERAEQASRHAQQVSLFGATIVEAPLQLNEARAWSDAERLLNEKLALGFYLSGHPFSSHRDEIRQFVRTTLDQLKPSGEYGTSSVLIAGVVESIRKLQSARLVALNLSDGTATQEVTVYSEVFEQYRSLIAEDKLLVIEAKARTVRRGDDPDAVFLRISAEKIYDLAAARSRFAKRMRLAMNGQADAAKLKELLAPYCNGGCPVSVTYYNQNARCEVELGETWRVSLKDDLLQSLSAWLSTENVKIIYRETASGS